MNPVWSFCGDYFGSTELAYKWKTSSGWSGSLVPMCISKWCLPPMPGCMAYGKIKLVA